MREICRLKENAQEDEHNVGPDADHGDAPALSLLLGLALGLALTRIEATVGMATMRREGGGMEGAALRG